MDPSVLHLRNVPKYLLYTTIFSAVIAAFLTLTGITTTSLVINFVMSESFGIPICAAILFLIWLLKPGKTFALPFIIGTGVGILAGLHLGPFILRRMLSISIHPEKDLLQTLILAVTLASAASYFFYSRSRIRIGEEEIQQEKIKRLSIEKQALEAHLKLLQAQVEPHFLFNTLSNLMSLIETNPAHAKSMLADLIQYLRTSLSRTLSDQITLDREIDMIKAYLNIQRIRMGERLRFRIEIPESLRSHPFPPMLLQPLVENAIKHGLEPKIEGGEIIITAAAENASLKIQVMDTGLGLSSLPGSGVGIKNVRERVRLLFGEKGRFQLEENRPSGVRVILEVPRNDL